MDYQPLYLHLFNAITDALTQLEQHDCKLAMQTLTHAQIKTEAMYLDQEN